MNSVRDMARPRRGLIEWAVLVSGLGLLAGCDGDGAKVYRVPKETAAPPAAVSAANPHGSPTEAGLPRLRWTTPDGWIEHGASGMSLVDFSAGADAGVSVIPLPARGVHDVEVMNIFRQRFKLPELDAAGLAALGQGLPAGPPGTVVYDMSVESEGEGPRLILAVVPHEAARWYVRLSGAAPAVEAQKAAFMGFVGSLVVEEPAMAQRARAPVPRTSSAAGGVGVDGEALPEWTVPVGWKEAPLTAMVLSRFAAGEGQGNAEITVSAFPGDVGGLAANVNRWRRQIGMEPLPDAEAVDLLSAVETIDGEGWLVDLTGKLEGRPARMVGGILPRGDRTWFYKMSGDAAAVEAAREEFVNFMMGARHPTP
jgi:hypothetical protein